MIILYMGLAQSSNVTKDTFGQYTKFMSQQIQSQYNSAIGQATAGNTLSFYAGQLYNCPSGTPPKQCRCAAAIVDSVVKVQQTGQATSSLTSFYSAVDKAGFQSFVKSAVAAFINQNSQNSQGFFAVGFDVNKNLAQTADTIAEAVSGYFNQSVSNTCENIVNASNNSQFGLCGIIRETFLM